MGNEWTQTTLGDFCEFYYGKGLPERNRNQVGSVPVFGSNGKVGSHDEPYVRSPGIIIGRKGSIGIITFSSVPFWPIDTTFYVQDKPGRNLRFTYYLLQSLQLDKMNSDSAVPGLNRDAAHMLEITVPPLATQERIAEILGTLDDKIELNRQTNHTLEAMARAIFKSWFVDFDPVYAKMEGRDYPLPAEVLDLFPDELVESELGLIPKGWEVGKLGKVINILDSKRIPLSKKERLERQGNYPYYGATKIMGYVDDYLFDGCYLLMGEDGSVITEDGLPYLQYVWGKFWANNHAHVLTGKNRFSVEYLYLLLMKTNITPFVTGAVQLKLNQKNMKSIPIVIPSKNILSLFETLIQPIFDKVRNNSEQSQTLSDIRDVFLPKLMRGEIETII